MLRLLLYPYEVKSLLCSAPYLLQNRFVLKTYKRVVHFYRPVAPERPNVFFFFSFFCYLLSLIYEYCGPTYILRQYYFRSYVDVLSRQRKSGRWKSFRNCDDARAAVRPTAEEVVFRSTEDLLQLQSATDRLSSTSRPRLLLTSKDFSLLLSLLLSLWSLSRGRRCGETTVYLHAKSNIIST